MPLLTNSNISITKYCDFLVQMIVHRFSVLYHTYSWTLAYVCLLANVLFLKANIISEAGTAFILRSHTTKTLHSRST